MREKHSPRLPMSVGKKDYSMPPALVLSREGTGFATVRGLSEGRMPITAITYVGREPIHYSRLCRIVEAPGFESDDRYMQWLAEHCMGPESRPAVASGAMISPPASLAPMISRDSVSLIECMLATVARKRSCQSDHEF